ncbi:hypothetical protein AB0K00_56555 [Dactylosporangium sp. NPDC049525]|uniref:hypothetical protein n=1 Tax=Dactylosporangium sp. NPDC049525 TaxID=3154730 RepID=UPI00342A0FBD
MWWAARLSVRSTLVVMAGCWVAGAVLLVLAGRSSAAQERIQAAPFCTAGQVFTATACQFTLDGTMTDLTSDRAELDVDGRHFAVDVMISGTISEVAGTAVKVTLYRGKPVHVEGAGLSFDVEDAPSNSAMRYHNTGMFLLLAGTIGGCANLVIEIFGHGRRRVA